MALELGPHNIRVNTVNPTVIMTEMGKIGWSNPDKARTMLSKIPLGRFGGRKVLKLNLFYRENGIHFTRYVYRGIRGG